MINIINFVEKFKTVFVSASVSVINTSAIIATYNSVTTFKNTRYFVLATNRSV